MAEQNTKVAVAVSGGIDSLKAALLLKEQGYTVIGLHAKFFKNAKGKKEDSNRTDERIKDTFANLGIEVYFFDLTEEFENIIINNFINSYNLGRTPNPCSLCNPYFKFGLLLDISKNYGAKYLATGHYANLVSYPDKKNLHNLSELHNSNYHQPDYNFSKLNLSLAPASDRSKDQNYFLSLVPKQRLAMTVFPLFDQRKQCIYASLQQKNITAPLPKESQEICFIPNNDYRAFLHKQGLLPKKGLIFVYEGQEKLSKLAVFNNETDNINSKQPNNLNGKQHEQNLFPLNLCQVAGEHQGLWNYTEGQRKGLGIAWHSPLYVLYKDIENSALILSEKKYLQIRGVTTAKANFLTDQKFWPEQLYVKTRYRQKAVPAKVIIENNCLKISFITAQEPPATGQIATVADAEGYILAGGIINSIKY